VKFEIEREEISITSHTVACDACARKTGSGESFCTDANSLKNYCCVPASFPKCLKEQETWYFAQITSTASEAFTLQELRSEAYFLWWVLIFVSSFTLHCGRPNILLGLERVGLGPRVCDRG